MATLITIAVATYCIVVVFIMMEKKFGTKTPPEKRGLEQGNLDWIDENDEDYKWFDFASGLSDTPSSETPCRPLDK